MITAEGRKKRAGFFENNVFVKALTSLDQIENIIDDIPHDALEEIKEYISDRKRRSTSQMSSRSTSIPRHRQYIKEVKETKMYKAQQIPVFGERQNS